MICAAACTREAQGRVRPVDPGRDMGAIADLIESAFSGELDRSGNNLIADLRQLAVLGPLLVIVDRVTPFADGYVYEQDGRLVGNVSITPEDPAMRRWFISNVAVHPDWQGRGIGRQLMAAAVAGVRRRGGRLAVLQVRTDNEPAQRLYQRLGFQRFDTVVELLRPGSLPAPTPPPYPLRRLRNSDWPALVDLARAATPPAVQQVRPLEPAAFRPSLGKRLQEWLDGLLGGRRTIRWGLEEQHTLLAAISILAQDDSGPARLDLSVRPSARGPWEGPLADQGLASLGEFLPRPVTANVSTSHPEALQALEERHFTTVRRLDQLVLQVS